MHSAGTGEFICGGGRYRLADYHDIIAAGRAASKKLDQIADDLCVKRNVLTSAAVLSRYCSRAGIPQSERGPRRVLSPEQVETIRREKARGVKVCRLAERYGVTRQTIWKELCRR